MIKMANNEKEKKKNDNRKIPNSYSKGQPKLFMLFKSLKLTILHDVIFY